MNEYLAEILQIEELKEGEEFDLSKKTSKDLINQKISNKSHKKKKRGFKDINHGMTQEELIEE